MALHVDYKKPYGHYTLTQGENKFKIHLCKCNALWAEIYHHKNEKGEKMAQLFAFIGDVQHMKNMVKNDPQIFNGNDNYVFHAKELNADCWKVIQLLSKLGKKITIK